MQKFSIGKRLVMAVALAAALLLVWNLPTVISLGKPLALQALPALGPQVAEAQTGFSYPRLGITAPITDAANTSPLRTSDWATIRKALTKGVAISYPSNSLDDAPLAFLTGHSSDNYPHPYSAIFAGLGQAKVGDEFTVGLPNKEYHYKVTEIHILNPAIASQFSDLQSKDPSVHEVVLVTCWPVLTTTHRLVVVGVLEK